MKKAYWKDIWRTITKEKKRFLSIAVIAILGVTMMCGLRASCEDLRYSADQFFDEQNLFDIRILSTLGLTQEDVDALGHLSEVACAEGGYNETVYTKLDGVRKSMDLRTLSEQGMNEPYILEGTLPQRTNEIVVTENYKNHSGKGVGDEIIFDGKTENFKQNRYKISGIIIDALDINSSEGSMGFRSTATTDYVGYVLPEVVDSEIYTVAYVSLRDVKEMSCYSQEYEEAVEKVVQKIESKIKEQREQIRYDEVYDEAMEEWLDGKEKMEDEFAKADRKIADADEELQDSKEELLDARQQLEDGKEELEEGLELLKQQKNVAESEFAKAEAKLEKGYAKLKSGKEELQKAYTKLINGQRQLDKNSKRLREQEAATKLQLQQGYQTIRDSRAQMLAIYEQANNQVQELQQQKQEVEQKLLNPELSVTEKEELEATLVTVNQNLENAEASLTQIEQQKEATFTELQTQEEQLKAQETAAEVQFKSAWKQIEESQTEINTGLAQYEAGIQQMKLAEKELDAGKEELKTQKSEAYEKIQNGRKELEEGKNELTQAEKELKSGEQQLKDGEDTLREQKEEYIKEKQKATQELEDAKKEIDDIDMTRWYVQDRTSLSGYNNIKSDADSIQAIGAVFPVLFLSIAILISLTTITRMVDEERGLIGTYQALGFSNREIRRKYVVYAAAACLIGGILGDVGGYVILPNIIFIVFHVMYILPEYTMCFDALYGMGGILLFEVGVLAATHYACERKLKKMPATLMRPKAPKAGERVLLERVTFIWKKLSFLNKVTARNIFRYKKRMFMTIVGIAGCTGLLLCGFTIKNTVSEMIPQQYEYIYKYDLMAVADEDDFAILHETMENDSEIDTYLPARIESVELYNEAGEKETIQLTVVEDGEDLSQYICLKDKRDKEYTLADGDIFLTKNATRMLSLDVGENAVLQNLELEEAEINITKIIENYLGNAIYMTDETYEKLFGEYKSNAVLATFSSACKDPQAYEDKIARMEEVLTASSTEGMAAEFESAFTLINMVVYVVLVLAALLAFVVLFTLSNTNISERERELATIKVLGFYNFEVHSYVNKETIILTGLGILCGMPTGFLLGRYVMGILQLPSLEFCITLYPQSYVIAGIITIVFAFLVNIITNQTLNKINMIEALKSVE